MILAELPGLEMTTVTIAEPFENVTLWQPDHPALYSLQTTLGEVDGQPFHRVSTRFGFRGCRSRASISS